jgi:hypothetical protein
MNPVFFSSPMAADQQSASGGWFSDIWKFANDGINTYFSYDLQKDQIKAQAIQNANQYAAGSGVPGAYDYSRFTSDGGLAGGIAGLKGDQVFLLALAGIAVMIVAKK